MKKICHTDSISYNEIDFYTVLVSEFFLSCPVGYYRTVNQKCVVLSLQNLKLDCNQNISLQITVQEIQMLKYF